MKNTTKLKQITKERRALSVPGAANGMFARVIEDLASRPFTQQELA